MRRVFEVDTGLTIRVHNMASSSLRCGSFATRPNGWIFPLKHADAENVAVELRRVFAQAAEEGQAGIIEFLPIQRLNAIMVITTQEAYVNEAAAWVERLDRGIEADRRQLYVYFVQKDKTNFDNTVTKWLELETDPDKVKNINEMKEAFGKDDPSTPGGSGGMPPAPNGGGKHKKK